MLSSDLHMRVMARCTPILHTCTKQINTMKKANSIAYQREEQWKEKASRILKEYMHIPCVPDVAEEGVLPRVLDNLW